MLEVAARRFEAWDPNQEGERERHGAQNVELRASQDEVNEPSSQQSDIQPEENVAQGNETWWSFQKQRGTPPTRGPRPDTTQRVNQPGLPQYQASTPMGANPNFEQLFTRMTAAFTDVLQQFRNAETRPTTRKIPFFFEGHEEEDPELFLRRINEQFEYQRINRDIDKIQAISEQLQGKAKNWFINNIDLNIDYNEFQEIFLKKFDSPEAWAAARAILYGSYQATHEAVGPFLQYKKKLFDRLDPNTPLQAKMRILIQQLNPDLRSRLRCNNFHNLEEFVNTAVDIENDLKDQRKLEKFTTPPRRPETKPAPRQPPRAAPAATTNPFRTEIDANSKPPSPCRYCGLWHFHRFCPKRPVNTQQGNAQGVATQPPREQTTAPRT